MIGGRQSFAKKLWHLVNDETLDCIKWSDDGTSFQIKPYEFEVMTHRSLQFLQ